VRVGRFIACQSWDFSTIFGNDLATEDAGPLLPSPLALTAGDSYSIMQAMNATLERDVNRNGSYQVVEKRTVVPFSSRIAKGVTLARWQNHELTSS
jgi:hypothetical protein